MRTHKNVRGGTEATGPEAGVLEGNAMGIKTFDALGEKDVYTIHIRVRRELVVGFVVVLVVGLCMYICMYICMYERLYLHECVRFTNDENTSTKKTIQSIVHKFLPWRSHAEYRSLQYRNF
jgi:hypothetical protein